MLLSSNSGRGAVLAVSLAVSGCQCGPVPCKTEPRGTGLEEEVCIPGGSFRMGHAKLPKPEIPDPPPPYVSMPRNDWAPEHTVTLSPFFIDKYEVTWGRYRQCVQAGRCGTSGPNRGLGTREAFNDPAYDNYPATGLMWSEAADFCTWVGKRLPTEAEWERTARGPKGFDYPWGNEAPPLELWDSEIGYRLGSGLDAGIATAPPPVGTHIQDMSAEGVRDLFASVREWVADYYDPFYYQKSPERDPQGPSEPVFISVPHEYDPVNKISAAGGRVTRGNNWGAQGGRDWNQAEPAWFRDNSGPNANAAGFRCVRDDRRMVEAPLNGAWLYRNVRWEWDSPGGRR
ncbi:MAG: formylglycine-generating enzyme family protein [Myxococcota bacterium]